MVKMPLICILAATFGVAIAMSSASGASAGAGSARRPLCEAPAIGSSSSRDSLLPSVRVNTTDRLASLRRWMAHRGIHWYLETGRDSSLLRRTEPADQFLRWLSGFSGSSGEALISHSWARLFTDSRYAVQADSELDCSNWQLSTDQTVQDWISEYSGPIVTLAFDSSRIPWTDCPNADSQRLKLLALLPGQPADILWTSGRPQRQRRTVYPLASRYTGGISWREKVASARLAMAARGAVALSVTALDEVAYLLNLRATVVAGQPYFRGVVLLLRNSTSPIVFLDSGVLANPAVRRHLQGATVRDLSELAAFADSAKFGGSSANRLWVSRVHASLATVATLLGPSTDPLNRSAVEYVIPYRTPIYYAKSVKFTLERVEFAACSLLDSAALVAALSDLERLVAARQPVTELSVASLVDAHRERLPNYRGRSFATISAVGSHAALAHYVPRPETDRRLEPSTSGPDSMLLLDSGGQYLGCTTDITRTLYYGLENPAPELRDVYTRVLMGVIDLLSLTWPADTPSTFLDPFARQHLWLAGLNYGHSTGHGIGNFLGVHEGPNSIPSFRRLTEGNFQSVEPGYYRPASLGVRGFGIRLETITGVKAWAEKSPATIDDPKKLFLCMHPVTWVPYDRRLIEPALMNRRQLSWLNWYHAECRKRLAEPLSQIGQAELAEEYLALATQPISKTESAMLAQGSVHIIASALVIVGVVVYKF